MVNFRDCARSRQYLWCQNFVGEAAQGEHRNQEQRYPLRLVAATGIVTIDRFYSLNSQILYPRSIGYKAIAVREASRREGRPKVNDL
jgi:hypothetical protein